MLSSLYDRETRMRGGRGEGGNAGMHVCSSQVRGAHLEGEGKELMQGVNSADESERYCAAI